MNLQFNIDVSKKYVSFLLIFLFFNISYSQLPDIEKNIRKEIAEKKTEFYQKMILCEQQKTTNQDDYDVKYYALDLTPNPATSILTGIVEVVFEVISPSMDHIELNFWDGMSITDVHLTSAPGVQLTYNQNDDILTINLDAVYTQGEILSLVIAYNGSPQNSPYHSFGFDTHNGYPMIWTLSDPFGARAWWPCKDVLSDKADSVDIRVTVPNNLIVASNGTLRDITIVEDLTTYWWHEEYPIVTCLVSLAIHPYTVYYDDYVYNSGVDTMKIHFYVFPDNYTLYYSINALVKDMISYFSQIFGEYPFIEEKYGHADFLGGGAMEHQTCSSFSFWAEWVYAHELSHQWWGDFITCNSFHHVWLNEGFATYSEALWHEHAYWPYTASEYQMANSLYLGPGTIYVEDPEHEVIFDLNLSYNKASWVLHMLRHVVGDSVFFDILQTYYASPLHQYGTATTEEFQTICEQVSGIDLNKFFQQWIYEEYYPDYYYGYRFYPQGNGYKIILGIDQIQQNTGLFWMPVDVKVTTLTYDTVFVVWDSLQSQTFNLFINDEPVKIELDADNWILKETEEGMLPPYAQNVVINKNYQIPGIDTLLVTSETVNPDNHNVELKAIIENFDQSISDSIPMFDDGSHNDSTAGDGIFSGYWPVVTGERDYTLHLMTFSLDSGYSNILYNAAQFTTIGPVVLEEYAITSTDTIANPGDLLKFKFKLKNESAADTVFSISTKTISFDTCATIISFSDPQYGDIAPGENSEASRNISIKFADNCPAPADLSFILNIYSDDYLFWSDSFLVHVDSIATYIKGMDMNIPTEFMLHQNYPNPFNPNTTIKFSLPKTELITLKVYNTLGQEIATLVSKKLAPGNYTYVWNASGFASGVYYYKIEAGAYIRTKKLLLMK